MAKFFRKKSKRMSCRKRYKIEKKVRDHNKKLRKAQKKKSQDKINKKLKKDPGVPNSLPFKDEILREAVNRKQKAEELQKKQKEERQRQHMLNRGLANLHDNENRNSEMELEESSEEEILLNQKPQIAQSSSSSYKEFMKVVEAADIVLEVLDARDPLGSRCPQVEKAVLNSGTDKRLVLVLNKIDLIPRENLLKWLKYLRNEFPTVAFKSSTQIQRKQLSQSKVAAVHGSNQLMKSSHCVGAKFLMKLLGNYCRNNGIQTSICVGVVGLPNAGKSSIINSLKRSRACTVGAIPGVTKSMQEVHLDKHIRLLDTPGVVLATDGSDAILALRNAVKVDSIADPILPAEIVIHKASKEQLMIHYRVQEFSSPHEFLCILAKRIGRLKKGAIPDVEAAARKLINDWNSGRIKYYTHPPESHELPTHLKAEFVTKMGKEFDITSLEQEESSELNSLPVVLPSDAVLLRSSIPGDVEMVEKIAPSDTDGQAIQNDIIPDSTEKENDSAITVTLDPPKNSPVETSRHNNVPCNQQLNKSRKKMYKALRKKKKKQEKLSMMLSNSLESALNFVQSGKDDYDFKSDYQ